MSQEGSVVPAVAAPAEAPEAPPPAVAFPLVPAVAVGVAVSSGVAAMPPAAERRVEAP